MVIFKNKPNEYLQRARQKSYTVSKLYKTKAVCHGYEFPV